VTENEDHEFAKELKMENKDLLALLDKMGLSYKKRPSTLKNQMSSG